MKINMASHLLKILLIIFMLGVIFLGIYILPLMAEETVLYLYPELEYAKLPILIICESLLVLLLIGVAIIMYLLGVFDKGNTFSLRFVRGLELLVGMCILASGGIIILIGYMTSFGGPGPLPFLTMVGGILVIWILAAVIMLIRAIVKKAIVYKDDYDWTV